ncbi:MAG: CHAT domain-containing protein [Coleofasciculaceae cyanobacterium]
MAKTKKHLIRLNKQVVQLWQQGNYEQAITIAEQTLELARYLWGNKHSEVATSLNNLAFLNYCQGRYKEAEPLYIEVLAMWKQLRRYKHPHVATSLSNLALLYQSQGRYFEAEPLFVEALAMRKRLLRNGHPDVATSLNNLASLYQSQGRYKEAEPLYVKALKMRKCLLGEEPTSHWWCPLRQFILTIRKHLLGEEHLYVDVATSLNNLASLYQSQGRYKEAEQLFVEVLAIWKHLRRDEHPDVATSLNNLALLYHAQGRYCEAEQLFVEALVMWKHLLGDEHPNVANILNNLALLYQFQGRYSQAEQLYAEVLAIWKHLLGNEHPNVATSFNNLAVLYQLQGRYSQSEQMYVEALDMRKRHFGDEHPEVAESLHNLAAIYRYQGRYSEAEQIHIEALTIHKHLVGDEHPRVATSLHNLAYLHQLQGRYSEAEHIYVEALAMRKHLLGNEHPEVAISLGDLASLYYLQGRYSQAEKMYVEALAMRKRQLGDEHPDVATALDNLALVYVAQGRYSQAEPMHIEALAIRKRLLGDEHPDVATSLNNLALLYRLQRRYSQAERMNVEALEMWKHLLGDEHPHVAGVLNNLAILFISMARLTEALSSLLQAANIDDKTIRLVFAFSSERDRLAYLQSIRHNFDCFICITYNHFSDFLPAVQEAFDVVLKRKALTASALAAQNEALYSGRYPQLTEKFRQLSELSAQLVHLSFSVPQTGDFTTYQKNLAQLQAQHNNLQKQLASQVPEIQLFEQPSNRQAVASALPPDSILVEFVHFDIFDFDTVPGLVEAAPTRHPAHYVAFVLPAGQPDAVQMVDIGEAKPIDDLIGQLRSQASDNTKGTLAWGKTAHVPKLPIKPYNPATAIQLSQALFQPIHEVVRGYKHLILAPDGDLNLVPFQILPFDETSTHLLMDEYTISYLSVGREILRTQVQPTSPATLPLVIADPDFDWAGEQTSTRAEINNSTKYKFVNMLGGKSLSRAPGTRLLGKSVAKKLKDARLYLDTEALETRLTTSQCPSIMLIATHGLFSPNSKPELPIMQRNLLNMNRFSAAKAENPMMRSCLALAGANIWLAGATLPPEAGKGFVFAQDIAGLDLWANELTVLSACDTARGDIKIGEGVFGLRRAFAVAGSKTLVMSLWQVPDKATALLMERLFDNLQRQMGRAEALQDAQNYIRKITVKELWRSALGIEVLKELLGVNELSRLTRIDCQEEATPLEHPCYWGAWICQGDTKPLAKPEVLN